MLTIARQRGVPVFFTIWGGQLASLIGSGLTEFALSVWVYQHTHSALQFALNNLCMFVPTILVAPLAGVLADRYSKRTIMIVSNLGGVFTTLLLMLLLYTNSLQVWSVYLITLLFTTFSTLLFPAFFASVPVLIPKEQLGRANGLLQMATSIARTFSPLIAGALIVIIQLTGIALIDLLSFAIAIATLFLTTIPRTEQKEKKKQPLLREAIEGLSYITANAGLLTLLIFFVIMNVTTGFFAALFAPMVLSFASASDFGIAMSASGAGILIGSMIMIISGGPKRRIPWIMGLGAMMGFFLLLMGAWTSMLIISLATFGIFVCFPIINATTMVIWQTRTPPELMGRVLASIRLASWSSAPLALLVAGPLADAVFTPALQADGSLASTIGLLIGVGPGRGIALLLMIIGLLPIIASIQGFLSSRLRSIDNQANTENGLDVSTAD